MERKFKVGDTVICPTASIPGPCTIIGMDGIGYIYEYRSDGTVHTSTPFIDEHLWELYTPKLNTHEQALAYTETMLQQYVPGKAIITSTPLGTGMSGKSLKEIWEALKPSSVPDLPKGKSITKTDMLLLIEMARTTPHIKPDQLYKEWKETLK